MRRGLGDSADHFPQDVIELQAYFNPAADDQAVRAVPGAGQKVPIWLLGSSLFSAELAAALGLPFAFASHFAPDLLGEALEIYRSGFRPSKELAQPHAMACIAVFAADDDATAARLFTSLQQSFVNLRRGRPAPLPPPVENMDKLWTAAEKAMVGHAFREAVVGSPATVQCGLEAFLQRTGVDELMVTAAIFDHAARVLSLELVAAARDALAAKAA